MPPAARARPPRRKRFGQHFLHDPAVHRAHRARRSHRARAITWWRSAPATARSRGSCSAAAGITLDAIEIDRDLAAAAAAVSPTPALPAARGRCARVRLRRARARARRPAARRRQPALQHLHAAAVPPAEPGRAPSSTCTSCCSGRWSRAWPRRPAARDYGRLTVMLAPACADRAAVRRRARGFRPPPQVWSAVVRLNVRARRRCSPPARTSRPWSPPPSRSGARRCATH